MDRNKELKVHRLRLPGRSLCSIRSNRKWCKRRGSSLQCQNCFFVYPIIDCNLKNLSDSFSKGTCSHLSKYMSAGGRTYYNTPGDNAIKGITNASIGQLWTFGAKCSQNTHSGVHWSGRINGKFKCIMEPYPGNELDL